MGLNFNTRQVDAVLPFHWSAGPVGIGDVDPYDSKYQNITAPTTPQNPSPLLPGQVISDPRSGQVFQYVKATVAVALGNLLAPATSVAVADGVTNAGASGTIVTAQTWTVGAYAGDFFKVNGGTGVGQAARIVWNTATTLYLDRELATALDTTSDFVIDRPFSVALTAGTADTICSGVAIGILTGANSYGWMQTKGYCPMVLSAAAVAAGVSIGASTTAGKADDASIANGAIGMSVAAASAGDIYFGALLRL